MKNTKRFVINGLVCMFFWLWRNYHLTFCLFLVFLEICQHKALDAAWGTHCQSRGTVSPVQAFVCAHTEFNNSPPLFFVLLLTCQGNPFSQFFVCFKLKVSFIDKQRKQTICQTVPSQSVPCPTQRSAWSPGETEDLSSAYWRDGHTQSAGAFIVDTKI